MPLVTFVFLESRFLWRYISATPYNGFAGPEAWCFWPVRASAANDNGSLTIPRYGSTSRTIWPVAIFPRPKLSYLYELYGKSGYDLYDKYDPIEYDLYDKYDEISCPNTRFSHLSYTRSNRYV